MEEAKAVINLKEGTIELQGPVDFLRYYLDNYQSSITGLPDKTKNQRQSKLKARLAIKEKPVERLKSGTCIGSVRGFVDSGFFNEGRLFGEIRKHFTDNGIACPDKTVRAGLTSLVSRI